MQALPAAVLAAQVLDLRTEGLVSAAPAWRGLVSAFLTFEASEAPR